MFSFIKRRKKILQVQLGIIRDQRVTCTRSYCIKCLTSFYMQNASLLSISALTTCLTHLFHRYISSPAAYRGKGLTQFSFRTTSSNPFIQKTLSMFPIRIISYILLYYILSYALIFSILLYAIIYY